MSDEHGWPDFSHPDGHDDRHGPDDFPGDGHGEPHEAPAAGTDSPFHDDLFGADDGDSRGFAVPDLDGGPGLDEPYDAAGWDEHEPGTGHDDDAAGPGVVDVTDGHAMGPVGADPDAAADVAQVSVFPPVVDVGPLPEPVDGFPWIDTGSLGLYHAGLDPAGVADPAAEPVAAQDLAAYAAEDLPPGVDPWAALADSDDPAASALAKWWHPES